MQMKFRHILPGVGAGGAHEHRHALIQRFPLIHGAAVIQAMAFKGPIRPQQRVQAGFRLRAADPHNGDASRARGGGQGGDGILFPHEKALLIF